MARDDNVVPEFLTRNNHRLDLRPLGYLIAVQDDHTTNLVRVDTAGRVTTCDCGTRRHIPCRHLIAAARYLKRQNRTATA